MNWPRRQPGGRLMCNAATESWGHQGLLQGSQREKNVMEQFWGSLHKDQVLLGSWEMERFPCASEVLQVKRRRGRPGCEKTLEEDDSTVLELLTDPCVCCGDGEVGHSRGMQEIWGSHLGETEVAAALELFWKRSEKHVRNPVAKGF